MISSGEAAREVREANGSRLRQKHARVALRTNWVPSLRRVTSGRDLPASLCPKEATSMRTPKVNLISTLGIPAQADAEALVAPKLATQSALTHARKAWQPLRTERVQVGASAGRSRAHGHMQHRRLGQRHR
jgi:hypothetical protein